ncbi:hypothetical protein WN51_08412 [Melipona quadrifasciata]|uniref:Uncharacterized protein n=1 Tax=Melipona quadrifasciata TaxID=166423 RepID=A0A0M9A9Y2_9HYME|nr:hypothetical protein WN51_08412 [Melipona quadrifasciata]
MRQEFSYRHELINTELINDINLFIVDRQLGGSCGMLIANVQFAEIKYLNY